MKKIIFLIVAFAACLAVYETAALADIIYVPGAEPTIQAGIDAAAEGDTVQVAAGTYTGLGNTNLDFQGKAITVQSTGGPETCIIDCGSNSRGFYFHSGETDSSVVSGFTIRNGNATYGGAILVENGSSPTITRCRFLYNSANYGGAIVVQGASSPVITRSMFLQNAANYSGGAMANSGASATVIENCVFLLNTAATHNGGAVANFGCSADCAIVITNCTFFKNRSIYGEAGGVYNSNAAAIITNCILWQDQGAAGKEITDVNGAHSTVAYCNVDQSGYAGVDNNIRQDPLFVDVSSPVPTNWDLRLQFDSPCKDTGTSGTGTVTAPDEDMDGVSRPQGAGYDMGAYEYGQEPGEYTLTVDILCPGDCCGNVTLTPPGGIYSPGQCVTLTAVHDPGCEFKGWGGDVVSTNQTVQICMDADKHVTATFGPPTMYALTYDIVSVNGCSGDVALDPPGGAYLPGVCVTVTATADAGCEFKDWSGDLISQDEIEQICMDTDKHVIATFGNLPVRVCVDTATALQDALTAAASNGEDDIIQVVQGTYDGDGALVFSYASTERRGLVIEGGYLPGCTSRVVDAQNTVIDGVWDGPALSLKSPGVVADFTVDGLTLQKGYGGNKPGGGLFVDTEGSLTLSNSIIDNNVAASQGGGVYVQNAYTVILSGNIVARNTATSRGAGISIVGSNTISFIHNTVINNASNGDAGGMFVHAAGSLDLIANTFYGNSAQNNAGGLYVYLQSDAAIANIYNNILYGGSSVYGVQDLYIQNDGNNNHVSSTVNLFHNDFKHGPTGTFIQRPFRIDSSNLNNLDPLFVDVSSGDYRLSAFSPLIDAGSNSAPKLPATDVEGDPRKYDGDNDGVATADIGADEYVGTAVGSCKLIPGATVIPRGGTLSFQATATNLGDELRAFYFATTVRKPNGTTVYMIPLKGLGFLNPGESRSGVISHTVPMTAPLGTYSYHSFVYLVGIGVIDEDHFDFQVTYAAP